MRLAQELQKQIDTLKQQIPGQTQCCQASYALRIGFLWIRSVDGESIAPVNHSENNGQNNLGTIIEKT